MSVTERLYYQDSHLIEFGARAISAREHANGLRAVTLDRTAFYPTGGGQPCDTGTLDGARVIECIDEEEAGVLHIIEGRAPEIGATVTGRIDWQRRLDHIQQHTGQHILSQAFVALLNAETHGFRMMAEASEIDVALDVPSDERIGRAVALANQIIFENRSVHVRLVTHEEAAQFSLRKDSVRAESLRIIEIEGFDMNPCGGTHAQQTGEVGLILVRSWERAKAMTRIEFVAGGRALADYARVNKTARRVAAQFSAGRDETPAHVARVLEENKQLLRRARSLEETLARYEAGELAQEVAAQQGDEVRVIARVLDGRSAESLKQLALAIISRPRTVALLGSRDSDDARLIFARSPDAPGDMNALMREACARLDGRGGGRADMAQGGGRNVSQIVEAIKAAAGNLHAG